MHNTTIDFPIRGEWKVLRPPGHHPYAIDFMKVGEDHKGLSNKSILSFIFWRIQAKHFYCWSQPIYSPIDGIVIQAANDWKDNTNVSLINTVFLWFRATFLFRPKLDGTKIDIRPNVGNYVMIQSKSGIIAFMAHMRCGSVKVIPGQQITIGQLIGEVGNSGNSTAPHLHMNLFDQMDNPFTAQVLPFIFHHYERHNRGSWETIQNNIPQEGEVIKL